MMQQEPHSPFLPDLPEGKRPLLGIVGHTDTGRAVEMSFSESFDRFIVDPHINTTIDDLVDVQPHIAYVCLTPPLQSSGRIDSREVEDAVLKLMKRTNSAVVLKSSVTPDVIERIIRSFSVQQDYHRFIYEPVVDDQDTLDPDYIVLGAIHSSANELLALYDMSTSIVVPDTVHIMNPIEASFFRYSISALLATKVTLYNQLYDVITKDAAGAANPLTVFKALLSDKRTGTSHWRVPSSDGRRGFNDVQMIEDVSTFTNYTSNVELLYKAREINDNYRHATKSDTTEETNNVDNG